MRRFFVFLCLLSGECISPHENEQKKINAACFKDRCYTVELAGTDEERKSGLMWREHLDVDRGMLFVYPVEGVYVFWMKNTLIPLDIIWLAADGTAVYISKTQSHAQVIIARQSTQTKKQGMSWR